MSREHFQDFRERRSQQNKRVLKTENLVIKRIFSLDQATYKDGALSGKTKELLGLVASMVLRCNDCIDYHLEKCVAHDYSRKEIEEAMSVATVVGGSIVIPHLRHAYESLEDLEAERPSAET